MLYLVEQPPHYDLLRLSLSTGDLSALDGLFPSGQINENRFALDDDVLSFIFVFYFFKIFFLIFLSFFFGLFYYMFFKINITIP